VRNQISFGVPVDGKGDFTARLRPGRYYLSVMVFDGLDKPFVVEDITVEGGVTKHLTIKNPSC